MWVEWVSTVFIGRWERVLIDGQGVRSCLRDFRFPRENGVSSDDHTFCELLWVVVLVVRCPIIVAVAGHGMIISIQLEWVRASTEAAQKMKRIALHQMVIRDGALILEVLAGVDQSLSASQNALFVLDPDLDIPDRVGRIDLEGDGLTRECPDKDL